MLNAIKRAVLGYKNEVGWRVLMSRAMSCDNSFKRSADQYIKLYNCLNEQ